MRLAFISDIHGNYYALKAVLEYLIREGEPAYDRIISLGDILAGHSGNQKVIDLLDQYHVELIRGNHDGSFIPWDLIPANRVELLQSIAKWEEEHISKEIRNRLDKLPISLSIPLKDGRTLLAFHSNPKNLWDMANASDVDTEKMYSVYGGLAGDVLVYGHYHRSHVLEFDGKTLVNVASVSGFVSMYPDDLARFTTIESLPDRLVIRQEVVAYDVDAQTQMDKETGAPFSPEWD